MSPLQKTLIQAAIVAAVLGVPLLFAESGIGIQHLPATHTLPAVETANADTLARIKAAHKKSLPRGTYSRLPLQGNIAETNIYKESTILAHGNQHTILPSHAIIHLPEHLKNKVITNTRLLTANASIYTPWPEFYTRNRSWLFTYGINLKQATGQMPIRNDVRKQFSKINRITVALYQNNPISIHPSTAIAADK